MKHEMLFLDDMVRKIDPLTELRRLTNGLKITDAALRKVSKSFAPNAAETVQSNPFRLCEIEGVGFGTADALARRLKYGPTFPPRLACGITSTLSRAAFSKGHVCLPRNMLVHQSRSLLGHQFVPVEAVEHQIQQLYQDNEVAYGGDMIYLRKFFREEQFIAEKISVLSNSPVVPIEPDLSGLAEDQIAAVEMIKKHPVAILTGPPGTGKSHMCRRLVEALPESSVALAAPTGKAAKRMIELTGRDASTIHRLLGATKDEDGFHFAHDAEFPLEFKFIVIDETSMMDCSLMYHLLMAVDDGTRLLFVGDTDQLPPVGPGNVLRDMIASDRVPCFCLEKIKRQDPGLIVRSCHEIRKGAPPPHLGPEGLFPVPSPAEITTDKDMVFIEAHSIAGILSTIDYLLSTRLKELGFDPLRQCQILSPFREKTDLGCKQLNEMVQDRFTVAPTKRSRLKFREGDKVIQTRNDYKLDIINGDIGYVREIRRDIYGTATISVEFESPSRVVEIPAKDHELQLAYCVTCHKYQGSEIDVIILPLHPDFGDYFVQRNWLYTAISRARRLCIIVGQPKEVGKIVRRNHTERRFTRLAEVMREVKL